MQVPCIAEPMATEPSKPMSPPSRTESTAPSISTVTIAPKAGHTPRAANRSTPPNTHDRNQAISCSPFLHLTLGFPCQIAGYSSWRIRIGVDAHVLSVYRHGVTLKVRSFRLRLLSPDAIDLFRAPSVRRSSHTRAHSPLRIGPGTRSWRDHLHWFRRWRDSGWFNEARERDSLPGCPC